MYLVIKKIKSGYLVSTYQNISSLEATSKELLKTFKQVKEKAKNEKLIIQRSTVY